VLPQLTPLTGAASGQEAAAVHLLAATQPLKQLLWYCTAYGPSQDGVADEQVTLPSHATVPPSSQWSNFTQHPGVAHPQVPWSKFTEWQSLRWSQASRVLSWLHDWGTSWLVSVSALPPSRP
jgi:hypothetical protein